MDVPVEAIEAAAEALRKSRRTYNDMARAAIEAAIPAIREAIAQEIEAGSYDPVLYRVAKALVADAARIVRGGTP